MLHQDVLKYKYQYQRNIAHTIDIDHDGIQFYRGHKNACTCICITPDGQYIYSGSLDGSICQWDAKSGQKMILFNLINRHIKQAIKKEAKSAKRLLAQQDYPQLHADGILSLSINSKGTLLASASKDGLVNLWDLKSIQSDSSGSGSGGSTSDNSEQQQQQQQQVINVVEMNPILYGLFQLVDVLYNASTMKDLDMLTYQMLLLNNIQLVQK